MIVIDASVLVNALIDHGGTGGRARDRLRNEVVIAPDLIDIEVISVLRRLTAAGQIATRRASAAVDDLGDMAFQRVPHRVLIDRCWSLRANATAYDAAYLATAELFDAALVTADVKLTRTPGARCTVELLS